MWKSLCHISSAVADLAVIAGKEVAHQFISVSEATESVTESICNKAATLRTEYESNLEARESGVKEPEVVTETETPENVVPIN